MAIMTRGRIRVPCKHRLAVDAFDVPVVRMADGTFLDNACLVPIPWLRLMYVLMAVFALDVIKEMNACIMLGTLLFMAAMAGYGLRMNLSSLHLFTMALDVRNVPVATIT
jgi:hypothetical protein